MKDMPQVHVDCWYIALGEGEAWGCTPDDAREADARALPRARRDFLITRGALRSALAHRMGVPAFTDQFDRGCAGKLHLRHGDLHCSVSHTTGLAVVAVSNVAVGVDVEQGRDRLPSPDTLARFLSAEEQQQVACVPLARRGERFREIWTRREAVVKLCGGTLDGLAHAFDVSGRDVRWHTTVGTGPSDLPPGIPCQVRQWSRGRHLIALALAVPGGTPIAITEHHLDRGATDIVRTLEAGEVQGGEEPIEPVVECAQQRGPGLPGHRTPRGPLEEPPAH